MDFTEELLMDALHLPPGTSLVAVEHRPMNGLVRLCLEHPQIRETDEGCFVHKVVPTENGYIPDSQMFDNEDTEVAKKAYLAGLKRTPSARMVVDPKFWPLNQLVDEPTVCEKAG